MRRKKLYYVPGLISLIFLPLALLIFPVNKPVEYVALNHYLPSDNLPKNGILSYSKYSFLEYIKNKKIKKIPFWNKGMCNLNSINSSYNNDNGCSELYLKKIDDELQRMIVEPNPNEVLCVEFGDANTFAEYVWLANACKYYWFKQFALIDDDFYIIGKDIPIKPADRELSLENDAIEIYDTLITQPSPSKFEIWWYGVKNEFEEWMYMIKLNKPLCYGFVALILIPWLHWFIKKRRRLSVTA